jgi:hypothetical protein
MESTSSSGTVASMIGEKTWNDQIERELEVAA